MECHICCEKHQYFAKYECKHEICYKCSSRLIYLYKDQRCPMCKQENQIPFFYQISKEKVDLNLFPSNNKDSSKDNGNKNVRDNGNDNKNIRDDKDKNVTNNKTTDKATFQDKEIEKRIKNLLLIKCKECKQIFNSKKDLSFHFKNKHSSLLCTTCLNNNHQFWYEYVSYSPETLSLHRKGEEGHIFCPHCSIWLYNKELSKKHGNEEHQICTICDSIGIKFQFYKNYEELEAHFRSKHFCCDSPVCIKNHCYAYAYKSELCAHYMAHHGMEVQLCDISHKSDKNPTVLSLHNFKENNEDDISIYSRGVNILNPLINEPYFPSFNENGSNTSNNRNGSNSSNNENGSVPNFLNRTVIKQREESKIERVSILVEITPLFYKEISLIIEKYISGIKALSEMIGEIEECVGKQNCSKILGRINFLEKQNEINKFLEEYKKELKFPSFVKSNKTGINNLEENKKKGVGFKVLNFSKK